jgi:hypothetical protein
MLTKEQFERLRHETHMTGPKLRRALSSAGIDVECEECGGSGVFPPTEDGAEHMGLGGGWLQACDECGRHKDDLEAFNAFRAGVGLPPTRGYPFALICRSDVSPQAPLEQLFLVRGLVGDEVLEAMLTVRVEREDFEYDDLRHALLEGFSGWLAACGRERRPVAELVVLDCEPPYPVLPPDPPLSVGEVVYVTRPASHDDDDERVPVRRAVVEAVYNNGKSVCVHYHTGGNEAWNTKGHVFRSKAEAVARWKKDRGMG